MRKLLCLGLTLLFALCAVSALGETPSWVREDPASIGSRVVVYSTLDDAQQATVEAIWYKYYPDCTIEWISDSVGKLIARARGERSNPQADVIMGGLFESDGTMFHDVLEQYTPTIADELMLLALDLGADDLIEGEKIEILTKPEVFQTVKEGMEKAGVVFSDSEITMLPDMTVVVTDFEQAKYVIRMMDALEEHDDVQNTYTNFDVPEEIAEKLAHR